VATSATAANAAVCAAQEGEPMKQVGHFYEHGNRIRFADFGDTVQAGVKLVPAYAQPEDVS
jgi:hypothetical protein